MNLNHHYISIVSHGHEMFIKNNKELNNIAKRDDVTVVILDNLNSESLSDICNQNNFDYISNDKKQGFGKNNNKIFQYCHLNHSISSNDYFIVINPDVIIDNQEFQKVVDFISLHQPNLFSINLFLDNKFEKFDPNIRHFPSLLSYFNSFLFNIGYNYNKRKINEPINIDWASASFLGFKSSLFQTLNGFDEKFYMYCEDIDICERANKLGKNVVYIPSIKALHNVQQKNRNIFSKHFWWHLRSIIRYLSNKVF
jgi:hypothetical protein